jgi:hypothetical protein
MVIDNSAYRPMAWTYPSAQVQNPAPTNTFMPSFQSSLPQYSLGVSNMANWGMQQPAPAPVQQQPAVPALQVPTTQAPMNSGAFQGATAGAALPNGAIAPDALSKPDWSGIPIHQMTGDQYQAMLKATQPSQVGNYANMALQGLGMAANIGVGIASLVQSQDAFNKQMGMANKNYAAQIKAYNNSLEDKIRGRYSAKHYANNKAEIDAEIERKKQKE